MICGNKKCDWWSDFHHGCCKGIPYLVKDVSDCIDFREYEFKLTRINMTENNFDIPETNSISTLEV